MTPLGPLTRIPALYTSRQTVTETATAVNVIGRLIHWSIPHMLRYESMELNQSMSELLVSLQPMTAFISDIELLREHIEFREGDRITHLGQREILAYFDEV